MGEQINGEADSRGSGSAVAGEPAPRSRRHHLALVALRIGLPTVLSLSGVIVLLAGGVQLGLILIGTAGMAVIVDAYARQSISSSDDREREEQARRIFAETGRWPSAKRPR